ncbi:MAG: NUDIX domain-containing protein [Candidatus Auribacterota bacterium]|jgi:isopentenyldiphosphate isomerase|nr:NUDIX domain-containing protein [Candidatus Auribacterota bacterium]
MEQFDIVDEHGNVIGSAERSQCHGNPALLHPTVHVLVFNKQCELWMQKRSARKDIQPGKWDTSVGGHKEAGEPVICAAIREMSEEIGITPLKEELIFCYTYIMRNDIESEYITTYRYMLGDDRMIRFDPFEIDEGRFFSRRQIQSHIGSGLFTPNFEEEWQRFLDHDKDFFHA